ncbi:MAG: excinuclease ABC subunit UvrA [Pseudomonadota bacterium]|nr:excinuclease ABC subunit UvrA [Pseudomonadota bacterium]
MTKDQSKKSKYPDAITVHGAKTHNLKNISTTIPSKKITVITGISGSGKSSFAFDTLYAEGQRRYVQSLSTYARQFVDLMEKPDVESIHGLSPAISIEQKAGMHNPRSTVGTVTEIYDYLRLLFSRIGTPFCPEHNVPLTAQSIQDIVDHILTLPVESKIMILAPLVQNKKGDQQLLIDDLRQQGFVRIRLNGDVQELTGKLALDPHKKQTIEVVVDRLKVRKDQDLRLTESIETALGLSDGNVLVAFMDRKECDHEDILYSNKLACPHCGYSVLDLSPKNFSFNNPSGACPTCDGLGSKRIFCAEKLIVSPSLSLENGVIKAWDKHQSYYYQLLVGLSKHLNFSMKTPWEELDENIQHAILYGTGRTIIPYSSMGLHCRFKIQDRRFEGVIPSLHRRYNDTESEVVRSDLGQLLTLQPCIDCKGTRLHKSARNVRVQNLTLPEITHFSIDTLHEQFDKIQLSPQMQTIAEPILREIQSRLYFLISVGLGYLNLARSAETLSGGEAQRIRLASQIGSGLTGVMYVLDEPSIGLHQRDNKKLISTLYRLRDLGNTVIVVEHDEETMMHADHIIDIGPGAGVHGGEVVASGTPKSLMAHATSLTGKYLSGKFNIPVPEKRLDYQKDYLLQLLGVSTNNLHSVDLRIPVGLLTLITGVSGSGKSSLINDTLYPALHNRLARYDKIHSEGKYIDIVGTEHIDKIIKMDQSPIGRTPRSNPATYTGMFTTIRELFAQVPEARSRGYNPGRFSFNVKGGRCEACQGDGLVRVEMHFLADIFVKCDACQGKRYNRETLQIKYKGKNIHDVLSMTVDEAVPFFSAITPIKRKCETLAAVGLGYICLGQSATTLSGGEAQRLKLSRELAKKDTGQTLYILDEPTTGLHFHDVKQLLQVLLQLRDQGNTIVVIEHNLDVIKTADWVIDIGPEGGDHGGKIIAQGSPEHVASVKTSHTGKFLTDLL